MALIAYRCVPSQSMSASDLSRPSMMTPVSTQPLNGSNRWMSNAFVVVDQSAPHQLPSLNHSLLWGFSPEGAVGWFTPA